MTSVRRQEWVGGVEIVHVNAADFTSCLSLPSAWSEFCSFFHKRLISDPMLAYTDGQRQRRLAKGMPLLKLCEGEANPL